MGEFSEIVVWDAWNRAGRKCECHRTTHNHFYIRCDRELVWEYRGREGRYAWEVHHITSQEIGGQPILSNCEILCWDCHKAMP